MATIELLGTLDVTVVVSLFQVAVYLFKVATFLGDAHLLSAHNIRTIVSAEPGIKENKINQLKGD